MMPPEIVKKYQEQIQHLRKKIEYLEEIREETNNKIKEMNRRLIRNKLYEKKREAARRFVRRRDVLEERNNAINWELREEYKKLQQAEDKLSKVWGFDDELMEEAKTVDILVTDNTYTPPASIPDDNHFRRDILNNIAVKYDLAEEKSKYSYEKIMELRKNE